MPTRAKISLEQIKIVAAIMRKQFLTARELHKFIFSEFGYTGTNEMFLDLMEKNGFQVFEEPISSKEHRYKILTKEDLKREDEEHAKRHLLATLSNRPA